MNDNKRMRFSWKSDIAIKALLNLNLNCGLLYIRSLTLWATYTEAEDRSVKVWQINRFQTTHQYISHQNHLLKLVIGD